MLRLLILTLLLIACLHAPAIAQPGVPPLSPAPLSPASLAPAPAQPAAEARRSRRRRQPGTARLEPEWSAGEALYLWGPGRGRLCVAREAADCHAAGTCRFAQSRILTICITANCTTATGGRFANIPGRIEHTRCGSAPPMHLQGANGSGCRWRGFR